MRKPHTLSKTKGVIRPSNVIFFDTETKQIQLDEDTIQQVLDVGYLIRTRTTPNQRLKVMDEKPFYSNSEFWDYVEKNTRSKTKQYLVAHNLVFDIVIVDAFNQLPKRGWELLSFYTKGFTSIFRWKKDKHHLVMVDNSNFFQGKLSYWGDVVGLPKIDIDFDTATPEEILEYNIRDVMIMVKLWRTWLQFLDDNDCSNFKFTVPSTALNTYRHRFMSSKIYIHNETAVLDLERQAYKGGRTEVFFQGKLDNDTFYYLDVNNLYGYILASNSFPTSLMGYSNKASLEILKRRLEKYAVIADVTIDIDDNPYPYKVNGKTAYPVGQFRTTLTTPELQLALDNDWIQNLHFLAWYTNGKIFKDYVDFFYNLRLSYREKGLTGFEKISKLFVNSLYGKFGQLGIKQKIIGECEDNEIRKERVYNLEDGSTYYLTYLCGKVYQEELEGESYNSFPAIAAHVTAYARLHMYKLMRSIKKSNVYYMDTDSLIVNEEGYKNLSKEIDPNALGKLKVELSSSWLYVNAPKDYSMQDRHKTKGIKASAKQLDENTFSQEQWIKFNGLVRRGDMSTYLVKTVIKNQYREIFSGTVTPSGWVRPYRLPLD